MPAANRVVCLLSNPLAVVRGTATTGVEGGLVELPIIDTEAEALNVEEALREGAEDTGLAVELQLRYATIDALRTAMTLGARVLHFAGHGHPDFLCFEDGRGGAVALAPDSLRVLVSAGGHCVRLVVVNSCHSEPAGRAFVSAGVPHVVAVGSARNAGRVSDRAALTFCKAFYLGIIAGRTVKQAFDIGGAAALNAGAPADLFVLLPEGAAHDERIFSGPGRDGPRRGSLAVHRHPAPTPSNAPAAPTWYVGRTQDLCSCVDALLRHRLTSITGEFGSGKSALAAAAAAYCGSRNHFEAVVWVKATSRALLLESICDAAANVLGTGSGDCDPLSTPRLLRKQSSRFSAPPDDVLDDHLSVSSRRSFLALDDRRSSFGGGGFDDSGRLAALRERKILIVVDDMERLLLAVPRHELSVRAECQRLFANLLSTASKSHIILTASSALGHVLAVTERVIKLSPIEPLHAAKLLLQRSPELSRRACKGATRAPRVAPDVLVQKCASHPAIRALFGIPFAISLSSTLLNALFDAEDRAMAAAEAARAAAAEPSFPSTNAPLEPLDRLLRVLSSDHDDNGIEISRLRDEIRFVIDKGSEFEAGDEADEGDGGDGPPPLPSDEAPEPPEPASEPKRHALSPWCAPERVAAGLAACWAARLLVDAWVDPSRAFSLRLDAVIHAALDGLAVALLFERASSSRSQ